MQGIDKFQAYRRMFASPGEEIVSWWYSGMSYIHLPEQPSIPLNQISAIMTYRTEHISDTQFRVHWSEIGVFLSPVTGEPPGPWINPVTGVTTQPPLTFQEGPGVYTVSAAGDGVRLELEQPSASIETLQVDFHIAHGRVSVLQTERKQRGFPLPDGRLPVTGFARSVTRLGFHASLDDLRQEAREDMLCQGNYEFTLATIPPHMGCGVLQGSVYTCGSITKAAHGMRLHERAWQLMEAHFPREIVDPPAARRG